MPKRIQMKRTKGWRKPEGAVYVGRPTKWGNSFVVGKDGIHSRAVAVQCFDSWARMTNLDASELRGKDLACWCPLDQPCHADVLLELANA